MCRLLILTIYLLIGTSGYSQVAVTYSTTQMGSAFSYTAIAADSAMAMQAIDSAEMEVDRIESLISSWDPNSETSRINLQAGIAPVKVSDELLELIARSKKISNISNGYFDISFASINTLWSFDGRDMVAPSASELEKSIQLIDHEKIILDREAGTVFLTEKGMKIGFGGIGKGYAANRAKQIMVEQGIESGVVNAGGDIIAWGLRLNGKPWSIGIADPKDRDGIISWLDMTDRSVVTSGSYEKFVTINGERHGHIINPKTGWPSKGLISVTIVCPDAELADALATTVFVLGLDEGLKLVNHLNEVEAILIDDIGSIHHSKNIKSRLR